MVIVYILSCLSMFAYGKSVPPQVCFQPFNWEDCGRPPVHVLYYYKSGSRCEVGIWRGCLPNPNMFKDEYECVNTCVYIERAQPQDFHMMDGPGDGQEPDINMEGNDTDILTEGPEPKQPKPKSPDGDDNISEYEPVKSVEVDDLPNPKSITTISP